TASLLSLLPNVLFGLPPLSVLSPPPCTAPQPFFQHPSPQGLRMHHQLVFALQVLRRQRRSEALTDSPPILLPHQPQHLLPKFLWLRPLRLPPRAPVLQPSRSF